MCYDFAVSDLSTGYWCAAAFAADDALLLTDAATNGAITISLLPGWVSNAGSRWAAAGEAAAAVAVVLDNRTFFAGLPSRLPAEARLPPRLLLRAVCCATSAAAVGVTAALAAPGGDE